MMFTSAVFFRAGAPLARELVSEPPGPESRLARHAGSSSGLEPVGLDYSIWPVFRAEIIAE
jgi:hypothetical protein